VIKLYTVDRIEDNIVILEDRNYKMLFEVEKKLFDFDIRESDIVDMVDNKYVKNNKLKKDVSNNIRSRFDRLKE